MSENVGTITENVISEVLHHIIDFDPEQAGRVKTALHMVLGQYEITPKCTELRTINDSWLDDLDRFCERKLISGKSEKTIERYRYELTKCMIFINKAVKDVTDGDINEYIEAYKRMRNVKNSTLEGARRCISSFFTWLHEKGYIQKNPVKGTDPVKVPKTMKKAFSDEELERIKNAAKNIRDKAIVEFLYTTGVRVSEMCALDRDDVKLIDKSLIVNGKGEKERRVYLTDVSCMYLKMYLEQRQDDNEALFVGNTKPHKRISDQGVRYILTEIGKATGIDKVHPHRFRTTCATNLLRKGMPIEEVAMILGHENLDTTRLYALVDMEKVKADHKKYMAA